MGNAQLAYAAGDDIATHLLDLEQAIEARGMQVTVHRGLKTIFRHSGPMRPPRMLRLGVRLPGLKRLLARVIGLGIRGERVRTLDVHSGPPSKA